MSVHIVLDNPHTFYTNLDYIAGRIILSLTSDENISAIMVKLEGESRTILMRAPHPVQHYGPRREQRQGVAMENHKILYKVNRVFPPSDPSSATTMGLAYTLRAGKHEYPFKFKLPFNNGCSDPASQQMGPGSGFAGLGLGGVQQLQYRHVKKTLPPSLTGFPGEAEIRYYVKVTVQRPSLFKENRRSAIGFRFLPIEPPRPPPTTNEAYARRQYAFQPIMGVSKKSGMFSKKPATLSETPPKGEMEARLPSPAILTCNEPIPLRLIGRKTAESPEQVYLTTLQITLIGNTEVRAQEVVRRETSTWVLMSLGGLSIPIGKPSDALRTESVIDSSLWNQIPLPNTVAPSFTTCNLTRSYELEARVGLAFGVPGDIQPQTITLPLRFQIEIFSGIHPPAALLSAMASRPSAPVIPPRPGAEPAAVANPADQLYPPQIGSTTASGFEDAPPSYEDAMADEIAPADGPRREYSGITDVEAPGLDEKGGAPKYSATHGYPGPSGSGPSGSGSAGTTSRT
ncbi:hypothetical protein B0O99DRAFT_505108 [Bisporella sp. PMI_857]|nr:hypothetical protein B0O99DRAFT_505108 [Bisporella sp. PMI_857]